MMKNTFDLLFYICLAGAVVLFITALIMFFAFDIHGIFNIKTGRAAKKTIRQMEAENQTTGRLRTAKKKKSGSNTQAVTTGTPTQTPTVQEPPKPPQTTFRPSQPPTVTQPSQPTAGERSYRTQQVTTQPSARQSASADEQTSLLDGAAQTSLLDGAAQTSLLDGAAQTSLLDGAAQTPISDGGAQTSLLDNNTVAERGETELLSNPAAPDTAVPEPQYTETMVLSGVAPQGGYAGADAGAEAEGLTQPLNRINMNIIKKIVFRDTDEIIA